jgi:hypothetical protein
VQTIGYESLQASVSFFWEDPVFGRKFCHIYMKFLESSFVYHLPAEKLRSGNLKWWPDTLSILRGTSRFISHTMIQIAMLYTFTHARKYSSVVHECRRSKFCSSIDGVYCSQYSRRTNIHLLHISSGVSEQ